MKERDYRSLARFEVELIQVLDDVAEGIWANASATEDLVVEVRKLRGILKPKHILELELTIMPKTIPVGGTATAHLVATGTDGNPFPLTSVDQVALVAGTAADVTFGAPVFNSDGSADVALTGVNADASDPITATVDGVTSNSDTLTITAPAPTIASVTLTLQ